MSRADAVVALVFTGALRVGTAVAVTPSAPSRACCSSFSRAQSRRWAVSQRPINDATAFGQVLDSIRIPRAVTGRPRTTPTRVLGDKAYSSRAIRHLLRRRGIAATIPERRDQVANRRRRGNLGGRPPAFDKEIYRDRNVVERCFARLKQFRAIATRFDKLVTRYRAGVIMASLILWLREVTR